MNDELGPEARDLVERALREESAPSPDELARIRRGVALGVVSTGALLETATATAAAAGKTSVLTLAGVAAKGALLGTVVAVAGYGAQHALSDPAPGARPPAVATAKPVVERTERQEIAPLPKTDPAPPPASVSPPSAPVRETRAAAPSRPSGVPGAAPAELGFSTSALPDSAELREEVQNLRRVQEYLRAGQGAEALRLLDQSSPRLAQGQLRQERLAAEVFAACQSGQVARARRAAASLLRENPATPSTARLKNTCVAGELELP